MKRDGASGMKIGRCVSRALLLLCCGQAFFFSPAICSAAEPTEYTLTAAEMTALEEHLTALAENNETLMRLLNASDAELTRARSSSAQLQIALAEARIQLETLSVQLQTLKTESEAARQSLRTANDELHRAAESCKKSEAVHVANEKRLRTQRTVWQIISAVVIAISA